MIQLSASIVLAACDIPSFYPVYERDMTTGEYILMKMNRVLIMVLTVKVHTTVITSRTVYAVRQERVQT